MIKFLSILYKISAIWVCLWWGVASYAQSEGTFITRVDRDTIVQQLNMDATYDRPFLALDKMPVALGGYFEANSIHSSENGISEGLSFQARRLTIFMSTTISHRIKFISELEFEDGAKEIAVELASVDVAFNQLLNVRGGIVVNPIAGFNQNHDGPKWEFVERPDVSSNLLPATWSTVGFGIYGKIFQGPWTIGYEAYLTNGFDDSIIDNQESRTFLPATKANEDRFEESNNGKPLFTGKMAFKHRKIGEIGISYMGGAYNKFAEDGVSLDAKRKVHVIALDFNTKIKKTGTSIIGEIAFINIDVPETYTQQYGNKQKGFFVDVVQPLKKGKMFDWDNASFNLACRLDYVDWNVGKFNETQTDIGDQIIAITPAISFRPSNQTVFRLNYRYQWQKDVLNNPASRKASWMFGFSSYF